MVREAAQIMEDEDLGSLPVVQGTRLTGIVTDRDIALRVVGRGLDANATTVSQVASTDIVAATPDQDLDEALKLMARARVRRLPIVVREYELVGMLSQADIARAASDKTVGEVVEAISQPPRGPRVAGPDVGESQSHVDPGPSRTDDDAGSMR
jgi:predicted transcriptional regulator